MLSKVKHQPKLTTDKARNNIYIDMRDKQKEFDKDLDDNDRLPGVGWKIAACILALIATILFITLITLCVFNEHTLKTTNPDNCPEGHAEVKIKRTKRYHESLKHKKTNGSDVFEELSKTEINMVMDFLNSKPELKLVAPKMAGVDTNFVHSIEMKLPPKDVVTKYLRGESERPERMASVMIFRGADEPPSVEEYIVGGIGEKMYAHRIITDTRKTHIPFIYRPFSTAEFMAIYKHVLRNVSMIAGHVLQESYDANLFKCGNKCLRFSMAPIASAYIPEGTRKAWFWFQYDIEFTSVRPLDFLFLVDKTSVHPNEWEFQNVWYANQMFDNMTIFLNEYKYGNINKTRLPFPSGDDYNYGTLNFRTPLEPVEPLRAPRQFEPDGHRFQITDNEVHYMKWKLNFKVSTSGGLQLFNIRFGGERIVYELSMQEVVVMYSGYNPVSQIMNYADGAGMYGTRYRGLLPGVDCPAQAEFIDTYLYTSNEFGGRIFENAFCVFELNTHTPLRRHRAYGRSGAFYGGLEATVLVIRSIISIVNYDYIFDIILYPTGAIETKTSMTGYLGTSFYYPEEDAYGTHVHKHVSAALHNHLFNFKVDIDIKGTSNRYETLDYATREDESPWLKGAKHTQTFITRNLKETELKAAYKFNFNTPKTHVFSNNDHISHLGNPRGYRVEIQKMSKQLFPRDYGFERAVSWSRYQMAVTKYKPEEERSSSLFTMWDARDPVINFQKYIDDDDDLVDQDLVAWITIGTQHLPQTENLPTTTTVGAQLSFHILPFNYFDEDPSMNSRDAVRITPLDKSKPLEGALVEQYGAFENSNCVPTYDYPKNLLEKNSTFLFS